LHCQSEGLRFSTYCKYRNTLRRLQSFCEGQKIDAVGEIMTDHLDAFRAGRELKPVTASNELQLLAAILRFLQGSQMDTGECRGAHQAST
jgi:hypothetical protein